MKKAATIIALAACAVLGMFAAVALAGGDDGHGPPTTTTTGGGHTPVSVCHNGRTLTFDDDGYEAHIAHGDTLGECEPDETETTPEECGDGQYQEECVPPPTETTPTEPTDVCTNLGGAQSSVPPGYKLENGICVRVCPDGLPPTPGEGAYDPNDDCKRPPPVTTTTTTTTPTPAVTTTTTPTTTTPTTTTPTPTTTPPKTVAPKPPKATSKPKAVKPKTTTPKPDAPKVCKTLADGTKRAWHKGGNGLAAGCYAIVMGSY